MKGRRDGNSLSQCRSLNGLPRDQAAAAHSFLSVTAADSHRFYVAAVSVDSALFGRLTPPSHVIAVLSQPHREEPVGAQYAAKPRPLELTDHRLTPRTTRFEALTDAAITLRRAQS